MELADMAMLPLHGLTVTTLEKSNCMMTEPPYCEISAQMGVWTIEATRLLVAKVVINLQAIKVVTMVVEPVVQQVILEATLMVGEAVVLLISD